MRNTPATLSNIVLGLSAACACTAGFAGESAAPPSVFGAPRERPGDLRIAEEAARLIAAREYAKAEELLLAAVAESPRAAVHRYNLACAQALLGKTDDALASLRAAVERGYVDAAHMEADGDLESLRATAAYKEILGAARAAGETRILSVEYRSRAGGGNYADPALHTPADWRDEYDYDGEGRLRGWTRLRGESRESFTADGALVTKKDGAGRPLETRAVRYTSAPAGAAAAPRLEYAPAGEVRTGERDAGAFAPAGPERRRRENEKPGAPARPH